MIDDRITRVDIDNTVRQNQNAGLAAFCGFEVQSKLRRGDRLHAFVGYSFYRSHTEGEEAAPIFTYRHMVTAGAAVATGGFGQANGSFKYLSEWGEASAYALLNLDYMYFLGQRTRVRLKVDNVFGADVDRPEIARNKETVPVIPVTREPYWSLTASYRF